MVLRKLACAAVAALAIGGAAPASAASFIGDNVVIRRVQGGVPVFDPVAATVGDGFEYGDNFFTIDITANEVIFEAAGGRFSTGDLAYWIDGLDFDGDAATLNAIEGFSASQIYIPFPKLIDSSRASVTAGDQFRMSFNQVDGGTDGIARITFGAAPAPVPEPATWAFMIVGFGAVGAAMRSARRTDARLAAA